ncbi:MAG: FAD-linked oxidase C-terminal domain-containing protein [candidate division FCPU426 bacterium]
MLSPKTLQELEKICGAGSVLSHPSALAAYDSDGLSFHRHRPDVVAIPNDSEQLAKVIRLATTAELPYVFRGSGTGLSGGAVAAAGGLMIHLSRLKNILAIDPQNLVCCVEPGVVLNTLNEVLEPLGLFYPPDPSSGFACTLGGNVAENAGGIRCFKYGVTANYVLGVELMSPEGQLLHFGGPEGATGIDWKALVVGSEGLLGAISKIWLRLKPLPGDPCTFLATFDTLEAASGAILDLVHHPAIPVAAELMDRNCVRLVEASPMAVGLPKDSWVLLAEINGPPELVTAQTPGIEALFQKRGATSVEMTRDGAGRQRLWKARKVAGGLVGQISPDVMIQDAVIPRSKLAEVLREIYEEAERQDLPVINVFHAGDGNLHPNFMFDARDPSQLERVKAAGKHLMQTVIRLGGTLSGEHGIGNDKMEYLPLLMGERELDLQRAVVSLFNPLNQLNPDKVLPNRSYVGCCLPEKKP